MRKNLTSCSSRAAVLGLLGPLSMAGCLDGAAGSAWSVGDVAQRRQLVEYIEQVAIHTDRDESYSGDRTPDAYTQIRYRGSPRLAAVYGDQLLIEGDILVHERDMEAPAELLVPEGGLIKKGTSRRGSTSGHTYQWPSGKVYYRFGNLTSGTCGMSPCNPETQQDYEDAIVDAMDDIEALVPGIQFIEVSRARDSGNLLIESDGDDNRCFSAVGYSGGRDQEVHLSDWCYFWRDGAGNIVSPRFSVHHELMHAVGMFHEHIRSDRDSNISIDWTLLAGCPGTAMSAADCNANVQANYAIPTDGRDIGNYDYDSVMHYGSGAITANTDPSTGLPYLIGQRSFLSDGDRVALNALYPRAQMHAVAFHNTGKQPLCTLRGREGDGNVVFSSTTSTKVDSLGRLDTDDLSTNSSVSVACVAKTLFWSRPYDYPSTRSTSEINLINAGSSLLETYSHTATVRVLDQGLIAVLF